MSPTGEAEGIYVEEHDTIETIYWRMFLTQVDLDSAQRQQANLRIKTFDHLVNEHDMIYRLLCFDFLCTLIRPPSDSFLCASGYSNWLPDLKLLYSGAMTCPFS